MAKNGTCTANAIQPQAVLIMGRQGIELSDVADRNSAFKGEEVRIELYFHRSQLYVWPTLWICHSSA